MQNTAQSEIQAILMNKYILVQFSYLVSKVSLDKPEWLFLVKVSPVSPLKIQKLIRNVKLSLP